MKTQPIVPATIAIDADGVPRAPAFGDLYHAADGALAQARHVFLAGNGLPGRWAGRERFVIVETGFGLGNNFLATWQAWRDDPRRCDGLCFVSVEKHPPRRDDLARVPRDDALRELAGELVAQWPPLVPGLHALEFDAGRVRLRLGFGDAAALLGELVAEADAFFLDGFAPRLNEAMWSPGVFKSIARLAAPGSTAATWSAARDVREGLSTAGFDVERIAGFAGKRDMTTARHAPRHRVAPPPGGLHRHDGAREALVVGAGLAGCATAWALAREGWRVTVLDRAEAPAQAASGNATGLFHGVVHADDGPHARAHRAAALRAAGVLAPWIAEGRVRGAIDGLLRLDREDRPDARAQAFAADHASWIDRDAARERGGLALPHAAWHFERGGWIVPADFVRALLDASGAVFVRGFEVGRIERVGSRWRATAATPAGRTLEAPVLVLATAERLPMLLDPVTAASLGSVAAVRGQLSALDAGTFAPRLPIGGDGYVTPAVDGRVWFGATNHAGDTDPTVRHADHRENLARLARLIGDASLAEIDDEALAAMPGRVAWRATTPDRLPLVGAVPDLQACAHAERDRRRLDAPRFVPRLRDAAGGLYVIGAFGSRGIAWAPLCAELLAHWITGAPCPVEADLRDALDPARAWVRARRR